MNRNSAIYELARRYWDREMENDIDGVMACYAPGAELILPDRSILSTYDDIRAFYEAAAVTFPKRTVQIVDGFDDGATRGAFVWEAVLYAPDGQEYDLAGINVIEVRDGRFASLRAGYPEPKSRTRGSA